MTILSPVSRPPAAGPDATTESLVALRVNGEEHVLALDHRTSLLDALRERLELTGTKKGCDHGQCGACTVLLDGDRINACLQLAVAVGDREITTVEGLATDDALHPVQQAFLDHDGYQCGYCTPGQICSAVGVLAEADRGWPSHVTPAGRPGTGIGRGPLGRRDPGTDVGQPVSLRRLRQHRRRRPAGRRPRDHPVKAFAYDRAASPAAAVATVTAATPTRCSWPAAPIWST